MAVADGKEGSGRGKPSEAERRSAVERVLQKNVFFIAATEKSGTTWLQILLNAHPEAACRGEGHFAERLAPAIAGTLNEYTQYIRALNTNVFNETEGFPTFDKDAIRLVQRTAIGLLMSAYDKPDARAIGEKTPNNIRHIEWLESLFPDAKYLFMVRDGRDVVASGWAHNQRYPSNVQPVPLVEYTRAVARSWRADVERARAFAARNPKRSHRVRYEDMIAEPTDTVRGILRFLGLDDSDAVVAQCVAAGDFKKLSGGRAPGQAEGKSHFRKGVVGDWRESLSTDALRAFDAEAAEMLAKLDYPPTDLPPAVRQGVAPASVPAPRPATVTKGRVPIVTNGAPAPVQANAPVAAGGGAPAASADEAEIRKAIADNPDDGQAYFRLGHFLWRQGRTDEALPALDKAAALRPEDYIVLNVLTMALNRVGRRDDAIAAGQKALALKDQAARTFFARPEFKDLKLSPARKPFSEDRRRNVIAFSLWGDLPIYTEGAIENIEAAKYVYPSWICRFYVDDSVPADVIRRIRAKGGDVVPVPKEDRGPHGGPWRFYASDDTTIDRFIARDCDSRPSAQERLAVDEWIASGKVAHIMRDHVWHNELILGGMWGAVTGALPPLKPLLVKGTWFTRNRWYDQYFLWGIVWPLIKDDHLAHDTFYRFGNARPFAEFGRLPSNMHVGGTVVVATDVGNLSAAGTQARSG